MAERSNARLKDEFGARHLMVKGASKVMGYWIKDKHQIYMLVVYPKSVKDNLTDKETALLRDLVKEL